MHRVGRVYAADSGRKGKCALLNRTAVRGRYIGLLSASGRHITCKPRPTFSLSPGIHGGFRHGRGGSCASRFISSGLSCVTCIHARTKLRLIGR